MSETSIAQRVNSSRSWLEAHTAAREEFLPTCAARGGRHGSFVRFAEERGPHASFVRCARPGELQGSVVRCAGAGGRQEPSCDAQGRASVKEASCGDRPHRMSCPSPRKCAAGLHIARTASGHQFPKSILNTVKIVTCWAKAPMHNSNTRLCDAHEPCTSHASLRPRRTSAACDSACEREATNLDKSICLHMVTSAPNGSQIFASS